MDTGERMKTSLEHAQLLEPNRGDSFFFGQGKVDVLLELKRVSCGLFSLEEGNVGSVDVHDQAIEIVWVLKGTIEYKVIDESFSLESGSGLAIPPRCPHTVRNVGIGEALVFWAFIPNDRWQLSET
jgi:mannose-6-phosphate isomerase-like protein (cupin superfamily)